MTIDERQAAAARISDLIKLLQEQPGPATSHILQECEALSRAINAFHMEGIRFRIFNVDRLVRANGDSLPAGVAGILENARKHLEAAGFHTRSHQAPG